jgi:hypothetical protein
VARVYSLREELAPFLEEENPVHAEHFRNERLVSNLVYLSDYILVLYIEHKYARERY